MTRPFQLGNVNDGAKISGIKTTRFLLLLFVTLLLLLLLMLLRRVQDEDQWLLSRDLQGIHGAANGMVGDASLDLEAEYWIDQLHDSSMQLVFLMDG